MSRKLRTLLWTCYFVNRPWVEYKGVIPPNEMQNKQKELELEANALISMGGKVSLGVYDLAFIFGSGTFYLF